MGHGGIDGGWGGRVRLFKELYDMGHGGIDGGWGGGLDYLKSCNKHIYSYRNYQHPGMHFLLMCLVSEESDSDAYLALSSIQVNCSQGL